MASQPPTIPPPLPAPGPDSPLHLVPASPIVARNHHKKNAAVVPPPAPRRPIVDVTVARRVVEVGLTLLAREMDKGGAMDEKWKLFRAALKALHADMADAEFDAALPQRLQGRELLGSRAPEPDLP